jgi:hypothetical protein
MLLRGWFMNLLGESPGADATRTVTESGAG